MSVLGDIPRFNETIFDIKKTKALPLVEKWKFTTRVPLKNIE